MFETATYEITIKSSKAKPGNAAVAVRHRGYWYWIADDDLASKLTFTRLSVMFAVTAGTVPGGGPVLTLPAK